MRFFRRRPAKIVLATDFTRLTMWEDGDFTDDMIRLALILAGSGGCLMRIESDERFTRKWWEGFSWSWVFSCP